MKKMVLFSMLFFMSVSAKASSLSFTFIDSKIQDVLPTISEITNKTFVVTPSLMNNSINLIMSKDYDSEIAFSAFVSALSASNMTVVKRNGFYKIVEDFEYSTNPEFADSFILKVFDVYPLSASELSTTLTELFPKESDSFATNYLESKILVGAPRHMITSLSKVIKDLKKVNKNSIKKVTLLTRSYKFSTLESESVTKYLESNSSSYNYFPAINRYIVSATSSQHKQILKDLSSIDVKKKTYSVNFLVSSGSRQDLYERGFGFIFKEGGISLDLLSSSLSYLSTDSLSMFNFFANYIDKDSNTLILSKPFFQMQIGTESSFSTGQEIPFITSTVDAATGQIIRNVERKNVGLDVSTKLTMNANEELTLNIKQSLSSISQTQLQDSTEIITDSQTLHTQLHVKTNQMYAVGGIKDSRTQESESFFGINKSKTKSNNELLIFVLITEIKSTTKKQISPWFDD